jgi:putative membrane protein
MMGEHFRSERFSEGIVEAVREVGGALERHFPATGENPNELPDSIVEE